MINRQTIVDKMSGNLKNRYLLHVDIKCLILCRHACNSLQIPPPPHPPPPEFSEQKRDAYYSGYSALKLKCISYLAMYSKLFMIMQRKLFTMSSQLEFTKEVCLHRIQFGCPSVWHLDRECENWTLSGHKLYNSKQ